MVKAMFDDQIIAGRVRLCWLRESVLDGGGCIGWLRLSWMGEAELDR